eukprot:189200-Amphidinium_carterae.2
MKPGRVVEVHKTASRRVAPALAAKETWREYAGADSRREAARPRLSVRVVGANPNRRPVSGGVRDRRGDLLSSLELRARAAECASNAGVRTLQGSLEGLRAPTEAKPEHAQQEFHFKETPWPQTLHSRFT